MRVAGVMSGTSLDGIDVAIVELRGRGIESIGLQTIGFHSVPYTSAVRTELASLAGPGAGGQGPVAGLSSVAEISRLNFKLGELYARAVLRAVKRFGPVELIGCHGQTVYHEGGAHTLQIGEPAVIAERTGVPVVSNFRSRDVAAGGQGAPLVPFVDYLLFRHPKRTRIALNIGGIANVTVIPPGASPEAIIAFDTGPGNMVIDALAQELSKGKLNYDRNGKFAASGKVNIELLEELMADPYYSRKPPKSAGREQYGADFVLRFKRRDLPMNDLIATATVFTARTIAASARGFQGPDTDLIVSGGGARNPQIMAHLAGFLPDMAISTSTDHGIDADAKEAIAFAVLARETWRRKTSNLPSATGARHAVILGSITP